MKRALLIAVVTGALVFVSVGAVAQSNPVCTSLVNTTPRQCATGPWLAESAEASSEGYGNFWPPECGPPGPPPDFVITTDNLCGCTQPENYYSDLDHSGCQAGPNDVSPIFEKYPWCYVQNGLACPAAFSSGPGKPAMRQCGGTIKQTGQANAFGDLCIGDSCGYPPVAEFLEAWAKPEVLAAFKSSGALAKMTDAGPIGGCDGPDCPNYTVVLPAAAGKGSATELPATLDLEKLALGATGHGVAYAGEVFDGRSWKTLAGSTTQASVPSCPNVGPVAVYNDGFPSGAGGTSNVPPTPCLSIAPCISEIVYGEGILFGGARVTYWFITAEAILYFTDGIPAG